MGATSVTGVGIGSADKKQKGGEHLRVGAEKIIGPRLIYANSVTMDGSGNFSLVLPKLTGVAADYVVQVTHKDTTTPAAIAALLSINANDTTVVLKGGASDGAYVCIFKKGLAI